MQNWREWPLAKTSAGPMFSSHYRGLGPSLFSPKIASGTHCAPGTLFFTLLAPLLAPKWDPRAPKGAQNNLKGVPKTPPGHLKSIKNRPLTPEGPLWDPLGGPGHQNGAPRVPNGCQMEPKGCQNGGKMQANGDQGVPPRRFRDTGREKDAPRLGTIDLMAPK